MAIAGPRLDRPSGVGDEGRPRGTSLLLATLVILGLSALAGWVIGEVTLAAGLASVAGPAAAGMALLERHRLAELVAGHALALWFGTALVVVLLAGPATGLGGWVVTGLTLSLFGIALSWADVGDERAFTRTVVGGGIAYVSMVLTGVVAIAVGIVVLIVVTATSGMSGAIGEGSDVFLVAIAGFYALAGVAVALRLLPLSVLVPQSRQTALEKRLERIRVILVVGMMALCSLALVVLVAGLLAVSSPLPDVGAWWPLPAAITSGLWWGLVVVGTVAIVSGVGVVASRRLFGRYSLSSHRRRAAVIVGVASFVVLVPPGVVLSTVLPEAGEFVVLALVAPVVFLLAGVCMLVVVSIGFVPDRSGGPAIAATGLVVAAIGLRETDPVATFALVGGALLVWDLCWHGLGLTAELGHRPDTRRLELVHGLAGASVAAIAVVGATAALALVSWSGPFGGAGAFVLTTCGVVLALFALRG